MGDHLRGVVIAYFRVPAKDIHHPGQLLLDGRRLSRAEVGIAIDFEPFPIGMFEKGPGEIGYRVLAQIRRQEAKPDFPRSALGRGALDRLALGARDRLVSPKSMLMDQLSPIRCRLYPAEMIEQGGVQICTGPFSAQFGEASQRPQAVPIERAGQDLRAHSRLGRAGFLCGGGA